MTPLSSNEVLHYDLYFLILHYLTLTDQSIVSVTVPQRFKLSEKELYYDYTVTAPYCVPYSSQCVQFRNTNQNDDNEPQNISRAKNTTASDIMTERLTCTWKRGDELKQGTSCGKGHSIQPDKYKHAVTEREWQITSVPEPPYNINASTVVASI
jgi:hypothetical protein